MISAEQSHRADLRRIPTWVYTRVSMAFTSISAEARAHFTKEEELMAADD
jgi:hypothetical protein